ncbi:hypothetical protein HOY80DRAFT_1058720 [Tuber brumale]|nr:hypothetical protein HOY80DRAFT_1058720 [Tuber brumale]
MGFQKSRSSIKSSLAVTTVLQQSVEKSLALESEHSKFEYHVSVLSRRLHAVIAELEVRSKITAAFYGEGGGGGGTIGEKEFAGGVDVKPQVIKEEVAVVAERKIVVRLPVAVAESVVGAEVAEDVAMVEVAVKGKEVAVVS